MGAVVGVAGVILAGLGWGIVVCSGALSLIDMAIAAASSGSICTSHAGAGAEAPVGLRLGSRVVVGRGGAVACADALSIIDIAIAAASSGSICTSPSDAHAGADVESPVGHIDTRGRTSENPPKLISCCVY